MIKLKKQQGKKIGIWGLGKTGQSVYQSIINKSDIVCYDDNMANINNFLNLFPEAEANILDLSSEKWLALDKIVLSPGIATNFPSPHKIVCFAIDNNIEITSDIDLLYEEFPEACYIGITGTNGKSTITSLIGHFLDDFQIGGNIGIPCLSLNDPKRGFVLELSSYQIELLKYIRLDVVILSNISPNHLDRYKSFADYIAAKERIFSLAKGDARVILNKDDDVSVNIILPKIRSFNSLMLISTKDYSADFCFLNSGSLKIGKESIYCPENKFLLGNHNKQNLLMAIAAADLFSKNSEFLINKIASFVGLKHRMQFIGTKYNISFYNDSKATTIIAAIKSISSLNNIFLLIGGVSKGDNISDLLNYKDLIKKAYIFGSDKKLFADVFKGYIEYVIHESLEDAFANSVLDASSSNLGCNILLAPACASTDQFKNFEERGDKFIAFAEEFLNN